VICWVNPFTGLAGDMLLGALLDAGAPLDAVREAISATGLTGWELTAERVVIHGLSATSARVLVHDAATERRAADVLALASAAAPPPVADFAVRAVAAIAATEGALHGADPDRVHLHELGGHDTVVDIVGTAAALHALGVTEVYCAPLPLGTGRVRSRHGLLPAPAPATLALLEGATVTGTDLPGETVTPTAAALLRAAGTRYGPPPAMSVTRTGYGAGTRQLPDRPNVASVTLGTAVTPGPAASPAAPETETTESLDVLETNLDDVTGETLGHVITRALAAGALDCWVTPATMKKGRPAHVLHVLARGQDTPALQRLIFAETGTLGIRRSAVSRTALPRRTAVIDLDGVTVRVKQGPYGAKPEHDDLAAAAATLGLPLRAVAERAARELAGQPGSGDDQPGPAGDQPGPAGDQQAQPDQGEAT
jgi:pyridinium-3,5-bisthiocarboxylic acid mononucleotide nickel chelatase